MDVQPLCTPHACVWQNFTTHEHTLTPIFIRHGAQHSGCKYHPSCCSLGTQATSPQPQCTGGSTSACHASKGRAGAQTSSLLSLPEIHTNVIHGCLCKVIVQAWWQTEISMGPSTIQASLPTSSGLGLLLPPGPQLCMSPLQNRSQKKTSRWPTCSL